MTDTLIARASIDPTCPQVLDEMRERYPDIAFMFDKMADNEALVDELLTIIEKAQDD